MVSRKLLSCSALVMLGVADWLTTIVGITFFGAKEANPLLASMTTTSLLLFSFAKLSAVSITGFAFFKAMGMSSGMGQVGGLTARFVYSGYVVALFTLAALVVNNISVIARIL
jgi:hypothetical protein